MTQITFQMLKAKARLSLWTNPNSLVHNPTYTFTHMQNDTHIKLINSSIVCHSKSLEQPNHLSVECQLDKLMMHLSHGMLFSQKKKNKEQQIAKEKDQCLLSLYQKNTNLLANADQRWKDDQQSHNIFVSREGN